MTREGQGRYPKDKDDVHYASIQFRPRTEKQESHYCNVKRAQQPKKEKEVIYASVQTSQANAATW